MDEYSGLPARLVDFSSLDILRKAPLESLADSDYLIHQLIPQVGLNNEGVRDYPEFLHPYMGRGLLSWQYPNQLGPLLALLSKLSINSYLVIGVRHGGTFILMVEYLMRFSKAFDFAIGVDVQSSSSISEYITRNPKAHFVECSSLSPNFAETVAQRGHIDLVLIDGDHRRDAVLHDFELLRSRSDILLLHDIVSLGAPEVAGAWSHIRETYAADYHFLEFTAQYDEVEWSKGRHLGLGVCISKAKYPVLPKVGK